MGVALILDSFANVRIFLGSAPMENFWVASRDPLLNTRLLLVT